MKTNIGYTVVAEFVIQEETAEKILGGLRNIETMESKVES